MLTVAESVARCDLKDIEDAEHPLLLPLLEELRLWFSTSPGAPGKPVNTSLLL